MPVPVPAALAAGSLIVGFAVAEITGVRAIGGIFLALILALAALRFRVETSTPRALALVGAALVAFGLSHAVADVVGAWPAVAIAALGTATAGMYLAEDQ